MQRVAMEKTVLQDTRVKLVPLEKVEMMASLEMMGRGENLGCQASWVLGVFLESRGCLENQDRRAMLVRRVELDLSEEQDQLVLLVNQEKQGRPVKMDYQDQKDLLVKLENKDHWVQLGFLDLMVKTETKGKLVLVVLKAILERKENRVP